MANNLFKYDDPEDAKKKDAFFKKYKSKTPFDLWMDDQNDQEKMD